MGTYFLTNSCAEGIEVASSDATIRPEPTNASLVTFCIGAERILARAPPALDSTLPSADQ